MRRMLCLILAAVLMLSHGTMGAAVPHSHAVIDSDQHHAAEGDHHFGEAEVMPDHDETSGQDSDADNDTGVTGHVHLVAGLYRLANAYESPPHIIPVPPLPAAMPQLFSREVAPLLEPPTP